LSAILKYTDRGSKYFEVFGLGGTILGGSISFVKSAVTSASSSDRLRRSVVCRGKLTCTVFFQVLATSGCKSENRASESNCRRI